MLKVQMPLICINRWTLFAGQSTLSNNHYLFIFFFEIESNNYYEYELLRIKKLCFAPYRSWRSSTSKKYIYILKELFEGEEYHLLFAY